MLVIYYRSKRAFGDLETFVTGELQSRAKSTIIEHPKACDFNHVIGAEFYFFFFFEISFRKLTRDTKLSFKRSSLLYPHSPKGEGGILFYVCPSFRPSKIFFGAFFSVTVDGRNLVTSFITMPNVTAGGIFFPRGHCNLVALLKHL